MSASWIRLLARLGRWPRRLAALLCLLLAAGSAFDTAAQPTASRRPPASPLRAGQLAVPVPVTDAGAVRPGGRVALLATPADGVTGADTAAVAGAGPPAAQFGVGQPDPGQADGGQSASGGTVVAEHLRVLAVRPADAMGNGTPVVVLAMDRADAVRVARYVTRPLLLAAEDLP